MLEGISGFVAVVVVMAAGTAPATGVAAGAFFLNQECLAGVGEAAAVFLCLCLTGLADAAGVGDAEGLWANNGAAENSIAARRRGIICFMTRMVRSAGRPFNDKSIRDAIPRQPGRTPGSN